MKIIPKNTVVMSFKLSIGKVAITSRDMYSNEAIMAFIDKKVVKIDTNYLYYTLRSKDWSVGTNKAVMGKTLNKATLSQMIIDIPEYSRQVRIAQTLDKLTAIFLARKKELEELDSLIKARFVEMFGDPKINPNGYQRENLADVADYFNGLTYKPENVSDEGTIVLRSSNIQSSELDFADTVRVNCKVRDRFMVKENDILMCSRNGSARLVGKVALIKKLQEPMSFGAFMMIIRSRYYNYLAIYFQMDAFRQQIKTSATTTINQITRKMLDNVTIPLPPMMLVKQFAAFVEQVDKSKVISLLFSLIY